MDGKSYDGKDSMPVWKERTKEEKKIKIKIKSICYEVKWKWNWWSQNKTL